MDYLNKGGEMSRRNGIVIVIAVLGILFCLSSAIAQPPGTLLIENLRGGTIDLSQDEKRITYDHHNNVYIHPIFRIYTRRYTRKSYCKLSISVFPTKVHSKVGTIDVCNLYKSILSRKC